MNQFTPALESIEMADQLAPSEHAGRDEIDYWLGASLIALKRPLRGLQRLERLLARNPKHLEALELVTQTYIDLGTNLWNEVAEESPETAPGYEIYGHALEDRQNRLGAIEAYAASQSLDPERLGPRLGMARIRLAEAKPAEALEVLEPALAMAVDPRVMLLAGQAAAQLGDRSQAERWLEAAAQWSTTKWEAAAALAALRAH